MIQLYTILEICSYYRALFAPVSENTSTSSAEDNIERDRAYAETQEARREATWNDYLL